MLQQENPEDFVIATGESHSVKEFVELAFKAVDKKIVWEGNGINEIGKDLVSGDVLIKIDARYFRPTEVDHLLGDPSKARDKLGWESSVSFQELVGLMVQEDLILAKKDATIEKIGYRTYNQFE